MTTTDSTTAAQRLLLAHFETIADAPGGIARLRRLILQLAVQGRLVEQDPSDEPASVLLERIRAEKARLVREGKLRQSEPLLALTPEELPYALPVTWLWVRFGDLTICRDGERIPLEKGVRASRQGPYDYYGASGVIDKIDGFLFDKSLLLIGEDGANLVNRSTPIAFIATGRYWVNNHAHVLDSYSLECLRYLELFINAIDLKPYVTGTAQPKMNQAKMNSIPVAWPPLAEQRRIVARVDALMALCDALEERQARRGEERRRLLAALVDALLGARDAGEAAAAWARLSDSFDLVLDAPEDVAPLRQAVLQLAVQGRLVEQDPGDEPASALLRRLPAKKVKQPNLAELASVEEMPFHIPQAWEWATLETLLQHLQTGPFGSNLHKEDYEVGGIPVVNPASIRDERIVPIPSMAVGSKTLARLSEYQLREGDIVFGRRGEMGRCAIVTQQEAGWLCGTGSLILRFWDIVDREYAIKFFASNFARSRLLADSVGSTMNNLNQRILLALPFPLPPLAEQRRIVARVEQLMALCDALEARLREGRAAAERLAEALCAAVAGAAVGDEAPAARDVALGATAEAPAARAEEAPAALAAHEPNRPVPPLPRAGEGPGVRAAAPATNGAGPENDAHAAAAALLAERGTLTNGELQAALGLDGAAARAVLKGLVAAGLARQEGERRGTRYVWAGAPPEDARQLRLNLMGANMAD